MEQKNNDTLFKRFRDWVNADTDLPTLEDLERQHHHEEEDTPVAPEVSIPEKDSSDEESSIEEILQNAANSEDNLPPMDEELQYPDDDLLGEDEKGREIRKAPTKTESLPPGRKKEILNSYKLMYGVVSCFLAGIIIALLLATVLALPEFGSEFNPTVNEVSARYIEKGVEETGAVNVVAGMILDYRAFDTLGESLMLFTATTAVIMLLRNPKKFSKSQKARKGGET